MHTSTVNLNTPIFLNGSYFALVSENQAKGFVILTVSANDFDQGRSGQISYLIEEARIANIFMISQDSREITVAADGFWTMNIFPKSNVHLRLQRQIMESQPEVLKRRLRLP